MVENLRENLGEQHRWMRLRFAAESLGSLAMEIQTLSKLERLDPSKGAIEDWSSVRLSPRRMRGRVDEMMQELEKPWPVSKKK
jgi:hypothetical protein